MIAKVKPKKESDKIQYPCLMVSDDVIVLFISDQRGIVVAESASCPNYKIGHYSASWVMSGFKPYSGSVELSND